MQSQLSIPKKINVGFQERKDTYTSKLAYVVYTDAKGVLRKQKSWDGWRDHKIDAQEFENSPTSGFVLNKKVGDYRGHWNHRKAAVRIYDPRDFEFEITVENLLFILEECSAIKGKGLEGEFVYAWDGPDLVLLPASSLDYKESSEWTDLQTKKITKADIKEGCVYTNKDNNQVMYLGKHDYYEFESEYVSDGKNYDQSFYRKHLKTSKQHVFVSIDGKSTYWPQTGFTKLATRSGEEVSPLYAEEFEKFKASNHGCPAISVISKPCKLPKKDFYSFTCYRKQNENFYPVNVSKDWNDKSKVHLSRSKLPVLIKDNVVEVNHSGHDLERSVSKQELKSMGLQRLYLENQAGTLIDIDYSISDNMDDSDESDDLDI